MPVGPAHDVKDSEDKFHRHRFVEEIAHGVHEDGLGFFPFKRHLYGVLVRSKFEASGIIGLAHCLQSLRHALRITMLATGADLGAPRERVPR